jgi:hypothetical protein
VIVAERPDWSGRTVVCIASGPSLTAEDCERVKASGHPTIVTNTTFRIAPWADVVFGMDKAWWEHHHKEVKSVCTGRLMSTSHAAKAYGAESLFPCAWKPNALNSGAAAIQLALAGKPEKVILLGYDCQETGGKKHWHGDHPKGCGNAHSLKRWPKHFDHIAKHAEGKVVNATRETALRCFPRIDLQAAL